jgi:S1-C subfamily serine protease
MEDKSLPDNTEQSAPPPPEKEAAPRKDVPQSPPTPEPTPAHTAQPLPDSPKVRLLAIALLIMLSLSFGFLGGRLGVERSEPDLAGDRAALEEQGDLIGQIAQEVGESVVSVTPVREIDSGFFGSIEQAGAGTGIILTADGLIMTNRHVIPEDTVRVNVTLSDGTEYQDVEVVGRTSNADVLDVAFLKIPDTRGRELKAATIGDSSEVRVGDPVVAIGNALGKYQNTVTSGIISGHGRDVQAMSRDGSQVSNLENVFQTDAAINEGNSGGPLVNLQGEVIGLNTAAVVEGAQNIGFAIPINDISGLIQSVIETGRFERPFIGVRYVSLTNDVAEFYGLDVTRGAYIAPPNEPGIEAVMDGSPAAQAGIQEGDIITHVNGTAVDENNSLAALINRHAVGDTISLTVIRDGQEMTIDVTLGAAPE